MVIVVLATTNVLGGSAATGAFQKGEPTGERDVSYAITVLGEETEDVTFVSPSGEYGIASFGLESDRFDLWHDSEYSTVEAPPGMSFDGFRDVNDSGAVVGMLTSDDYDRFVFRYVDGEYQYLEGPEGEGFVTVAAIGDDETAVGTYTDSGDNVYAVKWPPGQTLATVLPAPGDKWAAAYEISDSGIVVGKVYEEELTDSMVAPNRVWMWDTDGTGAEIPVERESPEPVEIIGEWVRVTDPGNGGTLVCHISGSPAPYAYGHEDVGGFDADGRIYRFADDELAVTVHDRGETTTYGLESLPNHPEKDHEHEFSGHVYGNGKYVIGRIDGTYARWTFQG